MSYFVIWFYFNVIFFFKMVVEGIICIDYFFFKVIVNFKKNDSSEVGFWCCGGFFNSVYLG